MLIESIKELHIQHDESLHLLRVAWAAGRDMSRLRPALERLLRLTDRLRITHVLLALNNLPDLSAYDQIWLGTEWMPSVLRLRLKQVVIVLASEQVYNQHAIETILETDGPFINLNIQFFTQVTPAMYWLTDDSPRLPALLAEWTAAYGPAPPTALAEPLVEYRRS